MQQTMQPLLCTYASFSPVHPMKERSHHCESPLLQDAGFEAKVDRQDQVSLHFAFTKSNSRKKCQNEN
jgi:hypothetical protein